MFNKIRFLILLILGGINIASAQNDLYSFSGDSANNDIGVKAIETYNGNIVVAGFTTWSSWGYDGVLIKLNLLGDTLWTRTFSDTSINNQITGGYLIQLADSGFMLVYSLTNQSCADFILLFRLNAIGDTLWTKRYGYGHNEADGISSIIETPDHGFIAVGLSDHGNNFTADMRGLVMKLDMNGDTIWTKTYKNFDQTYFEDIKQTPENDYIICGTSLDADSTNGFYANLLKIDEFGNTIWIKYFGLPGFASARKVEISNNDYLITGEVVINNSFRNYILKSDSSGNIIWCKKYELAPFIGINSKITKCSTGGFYFSENVCDSTFVWNGLLLKIDEDGVPIWSAIFDGKPATGINGIFGTSDGGCILTGEYSDTLYDFPAVFLIEQDLLVIKTDSLGFVNCHRNSSTTISDSLLVSEIFLPLLVSSGINLYENPIIIGRGYPESNICSLTNVSNDLSENNLLNVFPNPSLGILNISGLNNDKLSTVKLYDIQGNLILEKIPISKKGNLTTLEIKLPKGIYLLQLIEDKKSYVKKIIITNE